MLNGLDYFWIFAYLGDGTSLGLSYINLMRTSGAVKVRPAWRGVAGEGGVGSGAVWKEWCSITAQLSHPVVCILWLCSSCMSSLAVALIRALCTGHMVVHPFLGPPLSLYFFLYLTNLITYKEVFAALKHLFIIDFLITNCEQNIKFLLFAKYKTSDSEF